MKDKNGWGGLNVHLMARHTGTQVGLANLHGLGPRDVCKRVFDGVRRIGLCEPVQTLFTRTGKEEKQTWILNWSICQSSAMRGSGWVGACTAKQDLPPNMREISDLTELVYSCPHIRQQRKLGADREKRNWCTV
jgi:hypothetical protein